MTRFHSGIGSRSRVWMVLEPNFSFLPILFPPAHSSIRDSTTGSCEGELCFDQSDCHARNNGAVFPLPYSRRTSGIWHTGACRHQPHPMLTRNPRNLLTSLSSPPPRMHSSILFCSFLFFPRLLGSRLWALNSQPCFLLLSTISVVTES